MKKVPLIDRDGTLIKELPDEQIDSFGKIVSAEGIFKALVRSIRVAVRRDIRHYQLPSTKGTI
ncbi:MAG: hypothetical protein ACTTIF_06185 [Prevotella sp.]